MDVIDLQQEFRRANRKYWSGILPTPILEFSSKLPKGWMEGTYVLGTKHPWPAGCGRRPKDHLIRIHTDLEGLDDVAMLTLFHGMVHLEAALGDRRLENHGRSFHQRMIELALAGAFTAYW